ncbi:MAG: B12-binding domain-containing protein, partial [Deltaproteobacteria bacterium]|nr:B12-binding domain-containing protein [Deltaproteobacteria bacterium]
GKVLPYAAIPEADREACLDLLHDRTRDPAQTPLATFLAHFAVQAGGGPERRGTDDAGPAEQRLAEQVVRGESDGLEDLLAILLRRRTALSIINEVLVPAMRRVGELFGRGELLLPFVLQSAEVMKRAVDRLQPQPGRGATDGGRRVLLATVQGDVHDIGKNLVDIILSNNGYRVLNVGIKIPAAEIVARAREHAVDAIGLSGLLVKSALVMQDDLAAFRAAGLRVPVLLGGAALTPRFVARDCAPCYDGPVVYCSDAFAGLRALRELEAGTLRSTEWSEAGSPAAARPGTRAVELSHDHPIPEPPFLGRRHVADLDPRVVLPYLNEQALFRGRWGYRRRQLSAEAYEELLSGTVRPKLEQLTRLALEERLLAPRVAYGWFRAHAEGDALVVEHEGVAHRFAFPRQAAPPHLCLADYFRTAEQGGDVAGFFVATAGDRLPARARELFGADRYRDYLELHGLGVEYADGLAELWHERMRVELGLGERRTAGHDPARTYRGARYAFGYPACPDLAAHRELFALLAPEGIGVSLTESWEMVPELTTSALVAHHPQAGYFAV